jgi:hypothetical protein
MLLSATRPTSASPANTPNASRDPSARACASAAISARWRSSVNHSSARSGSVGWKWPRLRSRRASSCGASFGVSARRTMSGDGAAVITRQGLALRRATTDDLRRSAD